MKDESEDATAAENTVMYVRGGLICQPGGSINMLCEMSTRKNALSLTY